MEVRRKRKVKWHSNRMAFRLADVAKPCQFFAAILERIGQLAIQPAVCPSGRDASFWQNTSGFGDGCDDISFLSVIYARAISVEELVGHRDRPRDRILEGESARQLEGREPLC